MKPSTQPLAVALGFCTIAHGIEVDFTSDKAVDAGASTIAYGLMKYYTGNNTGDVPGNLPAPYFWWEAGAMFGTLIDYWYLTGDDTYNNVTIQGMTFQAGDNRDLMPANQTDTEGNDDQGFWAMAAMSAAERIFPNPPSDQPQWLALAQAVLNEYVSRWDTKDCGGGIRWQIFNFNNGYNYKNSIANGCFFNLAARLSRYTGNSTYSDWAEKVFDWEVKAGLITDKYEIFDGTTINADHTCSVTDTNQWSYNNAVYLYGSAVMYNITKSSTWKSRVDGFLAHAQTEFFKDGVMYEPYCEPASNCDLDQQSFKGYLARGLSATAELAPYTFNTILPLLNSNAKAAAASCSGSPTAGFYGEPGTACGYSWVNQSFDGEVGIGEQMSALSAVMYTLTKDTQAPATNKTGGTSQGDYSAGTPNTNPHLYSKITTGDKVGAGFLTIALLMSLIAGMLFLLKD